MSRKIIFTSEYDKCNLLLLDFLFKKLGFFLFRSYLIYTCVYGTSEVINLICNFCVNFIIWNYCMWQQSMMECCKCIPEGGTYSLCWWYLETSCAGKLSCIRKLKVHMDVQHDKWSWQIYQDNSLYFQVLFFFFFFLTFASKAV